MADQTTKDVTEIRRTTPGPFASLTCGLTGHAYRVVVARNEPTALECKCCSKTWPIAVRESDGG